MKHLYNLITILALASVLGACQKAEQPASLKSYTFKATINGGATWQQGAKVWPCDQDNRFREGVTSTLIRGEGTNVGEFRLPTCTEVRDFILYPYAPQLAPAIRDGKLEVYLPRELDYAAITDTHLMVAHGFGRTSPEYLNAAGIVFKPAVVLLSFRLTNIPADACALYLTTDKRIVGVFDYDATHGFYTTEDCPTLSNNDKLRVALPQNDGSLDFSIAIPAGVYREIKVRLAKYTNDLHLYESIVWPGSGYYTAASYENGRTLNAGAVLELGEINVQ